MKGLPGVRERTEELERASLSTWATAAAESKGRDRLEEPDDLRTAFQVDRDRILASDAFRRLRGKSKLLLASDPSEGLVRARLDDALQVAQASRTVGRGLRLNEDLVEAIALGRDLGRGPFGDADEEAFGVFCDDGFAHGEQSLRIVERLERDGRGLNLTWEVRDGIVNHHAGGPLPATLEGQVVAVVGRVAALVGDLEAAERVGLVDPDDVPGEVVGALGRDRDERVESLVADAVAATADRPEVTLSARVAAAAQSLEAFLVARVGGAPAVVAERDRAVHCLRSLAVFELESGDPTLPHGADGAAVDAVVDRLVQLTDRSAVAAFVARFSPSLGA